MAADGIWDQGTEDVVRTCQEARINNYIPIDKGYRSKRICITKCGNRSIWRRVRQNKGEVATSDKLWAASTFMQLLVTCSL